MDLASLNGQKVSREELNVLPTPMSRDYKGDTAPHKRNGVVQTDSVERAIFHSGEVKGTNWGKFTPAIKRWEQVLARTAPAPTKPDGKEGTHRLSSAFTEWLMGLPEGWVTDVGLTRNEELKACGNGVVPQQAATALRALLHDTPWSKIKEGRPR
jgi:DNA (cytosine-5)-methyltransferase 1